MKIYTDGATSFNGYENAVGGWAYVVIDENDVIIQKGRGKIPGGTNNICEMTAILKGCEAVSHLKEPHIIFSDSSYCINCYLQGWYKKWEQNGWKTSSGTPVKNINLWKELLPYFKNEFFDFKKVKGHSNDKWNNYVDNEAVMAKEL